MASIIGPDGKRRVLSSAKKDPVRILGSTKKSPANTTTYTSNVVTSAIPGVKADPPKIVQVIKRSVLLDHCCERCGKVNVIGDVVLDQILHVGTLIHHITTCKKCLAKMLDKAPKSSSEEEQAFESLRNEIMETGKAFPK